MKKFILILVSIFVISSMNLNAFAASSKPGSKSKATAIVFKDKNFEAAVRKAIKKNKGVIYSSDVSGIKELIIEASKIKKIDDIKWFTNLTYLYLGCLWDDEKGYIEVNSNSISDLTPLKSLKKLTNLYLIGDNLKDITTLKDMKNLKVLNLGCNKISNINPLGELKNLTALDLYSNNISDIKVLGKLTNLNELTLFSNKISDISVLKNLTKLTDLSLMINNISDISALSKLTKIKTLTLGFNKINDISALEGLTALTELDLVYNDISDISPLSGLNKLKKLGLGNNPIDDYSPVEEIYNYLDEVDFQLNGTDGGTDEDMDSDSADADITDAFSELKENIADEGGWGYDAETQSKLFNEERIRLGDDFETALMDLIEGNVTAHYWSSIFLTEPEYLDGNDPLYEQYFYIVDKGIELAMQDKGSDDYYYAVSFNVNAAVISQKIGNKEYAIKYKAAAEKIKKEDPDAFMGGWPAMSREDADLYESIQ